jgi:hypothetical protein
MWGGLLGLENNFPLQGFSIRIVRRNEKSYIKIFMRKFLSLVYVTGYKTILHENITRVWRHTVKIPGRDESTSRNFPVELHVQLL